ncbi:LysR family transcriptional regulator [Pigmentiphaga sp. GD03639]|uniref:LysR family transcriptional regulator n=1 Tax=Pigmentiphaga sp. GD03639 TaxID=2975354 RepID=UPI00244BEBB3|nr:LysR family transcriptional regulator [Pigmentiphaga sp. GD03639]MDH2237407.1 LysR family transcriptional regulator [Pigmentiphaga sp. GD03639]
MIDALTLDQMRVFAAVAETGSFRAGAGRLRRAQSAVSHAIARMEGELGVALFDRGGHRPVLTHEGQALLSNVRDILLRVDAMRARARGMGEGVELELALVVDTLFPIAWVAQALNAMRSRYPAVAVRLAVEPLGGPLSGLLDRRYGVGITVGEHFRSPKIAMQALAAVEVVAVAGASHPLAATAPPLQMADLAGHLQIVLADPSSLTPGQDFGVLSPQTCRVNTQDTKHQLILAGVGWGRLPAWQVERDLAEGRLVRLAVSALGRDSSLASEAYLAHRVDAPPGPAARAFCQALAAAAKR